MITKIDFFIRCRAGGGYLARSQTPALEAEGETLSALRAAVRKVVRNRLGEDRPFSLLVGQSETPVVRRMAIVPPSSEVAVEG
jgi:hypothetical protein